MKKPTPKRKLIVAKDHEPQVLRDLRHQAEDASRVRVLQDIMVAAVLMPEPTIHEIRVEIPVGLLQAIFRHLDRKEWRIKSLMDDLVKYDPLMAMADKEVKSWREPVKGKK